MHKSSAIPYYFIPKMCAPAQILGAKIRERNENQ